MKEQLSTGSRNTASWKEETQGRSGDGARGDQGETRPSDPPFWVEPQSSVLGELSIEDTGAEIQTARKGCASGNRALDKSRSPAHTQRLCLSFCLD